MLGSTREGLTSAAMIEADVVLNRSLIFKSFGLLFFSFLAIGLLFLSPRAIAATQHHGLPEKYEHWLDAEVNYIITDEEKKIFLHLPTDKDRDKFIETFWAVRNPDPNSPTNAYREEHYRRLDYANN